MSNDIIDELVVRTKCEALKLLSIPQEKLLEQANIIRQEVFGNVIDICAIINARSGNCSMDCSFCSQSMHNKTGIQTFGLLPNQELADRVMELAATPVNHIGIVTSGSALGQTEIERLCSFLISLPGQIRKKICTSLGRIDNKKLASIRSAGLKRYHHNLESSANFYSKICTTQLWTERRQTVCNARMAGLEVCSGGLFGLGETWEDRISLAFSLKENGIQNIPINFLHPHPATPLGNRPIMPVDEALSIIAIFRHILPTATLRICGGRPETFGAHQKEIFYAGANAMMTGNYLTTNGQTIEKDMAMISSLGLSQLQL